MTIQKDTQMESRNGWHKNTREKTRGEIESLVGKENLTAKELALYLYVDEKTIRNYIRRLCRSGNELKEADFKSNGKYIVKPEVQKIFIILVNANWDKSHKHKIRYKKQISEELIEKIENNLDAEDKKRIQSSEPYLNAKLEKNLIEKYFLAWHMLNEVIFQTDTKIRFRYIEKVIKTVSKMRGIITVNKKTCLLYTSIFIILSFPPMPPLQILSLIRQASLCYMCPRSLFPASVSYSGSEPLPLLLPSCQALPVRKSSVLWRCRSFSALFPLFLMPVSLYCRFLQQLSLSVHKQAAPYRLQSQGH